MSDFSSEMMEILEYGGIIVVVRGFGETTWTKRVERLKGSKVNSENPNLLVMHLWFDWMQTTNDNSVVLRSPNYNPNNRMLATLCWFSKCFAADILNPFGIEILEC